MFFNLFPNLERQQRLDLVERLQEDAKWNINFGMMLGCSVLIAGLGLLKDSIGVIIGAMLAAPLMTTLIAGGLAIVQGNEVLLRNSVKSMFYGVIISLAIGIIIQRITPSVDLTLELISRGSPNILDLFIAFSAGIAAAYAIVLASALVFRGHGLHISRSGKKPPKMIVWSLILLLCGVVLLVAPLGYKHAKQLRKGQVRPIAFPVSRDVYNAVNDRVNQEKGVKLAIIG